MGGSCDNTMSNFVKAAKLSSNVVVPFYPSICSALGISSDAKMFTSSVGFHYSGRCNIASHCTLNFHFPDSVCQSFL